MVLPSECSFPVQIRGKLKGVLKNLLFGHNLKRGASSLHGNALNPRPKFATFRKGIRRRILPFSLSITVCSLLFPISSYPFGQS